jgi:hypothetical protein
MVLSGPFSGILLFFGLAALAVCIGHYSGGGYHRDL